jgi:hypothetical protein
VLDSETLLAFFRKHASPEMKDNGDHVTVLFKPGDPELLVRHKKLPDKPSTMHCGGGTHESMVLPTTAATRPEVTRRQE